MLRISIWTAIFLVLLRLAIGWHFLFEGYHKIESVYIGQTDSNRPFSGVGFFREARGPVGNWARDFLDIDLDKEALARLSLQEPPRDVDPGQVKLYTLMPPELDREWNDYLARFVAFYKIDEHSQKRADASLKQSKEAAVRWLREGKKTIKKRNPAGTPAGDAEITVTTPQRFADFKQLLRKIEDIYSRELAVRKDVEKPELRALRVEAAAAREDLLKDLDTYTVRMQDGLAELVKDRTSGFNPRLWDVSDIDGSMLRLLEPKEQNLAVGSEDQGMPPDLGEQWDRYATYVKQFGPSMDGPQQEAADKKLARAKRVYVRWLTGKDEYTGETDEQSDVKKRLDAYRAAVEPYRRLQAEWAQASWFFPRSQSPELLKAKREVEYLRAGFQADIQRHTDTMKNQIGGVLTAEQKKGYAPPAEAKGLLGQSRTPQQQLDWLTRWGLTVIGAMLMLGLFTRTACLAGAGFLIMTFLLHPALPWLPAAPMSEGYYVFVNKNVVELIALLALATTASGKWLGLDALISRIFCRRRER